MPSGLRESMVQYLRLSALLSRIARMNVNADDPRIALRAFASRRGLACDVWEPKAASPETVIALHGATLNGRSDDRLQSFARSLAASGVRCYVPTLPGLATMQFLSSDAEALAELATDVATRHAAPVLVGFSFGGSCALRAASIAGEQVRYVLSFGAAHCYEQLFDELRIKWRVPPADARERKERLYVDLMMAYRSAATLGLDRDLERIASPLRRFCHGLPPAEMESLERLLAPLKPIEVANREADRAELRAASPARQLHGLKCATGLIHDPTDVLVLPHHANGLWNEITSQHGTERHRLLVTSVFDHVDLKRFRLSEVGSLVKMMEPLVA